jgi:hypothetical protein
MEDSFDHLVYSRNVIEFVTVSREYCQFFEHVSTFDKRKVVEVSLRLLPLLYLKAVVLPKPSPELDDVLEKFVTEEDYNFIRDSIEAKLGHHNDYLEVFTPDIDRSEGALSSSIAEDLTDIYQDLRDFLEGYKTGLTEVMNDCLMDLINNFEIYWGQKLVNCLRALHNVQYSGDELSDEVVAKKADREAGLNHDDWIFSRRQKEWSEEDDDSMLM